MRNEGSMARTGRPPSLTWRTAWQGRTRQKEWKSYNGRTLIRSRDGSVALTREKQKSGRLHVGEKPLGSHLPYQAPNSRQPNCPLGPKVVRVWRSRAKKSTLQAGRETLAPRQSCRELRILSSAGRAESENIREKSPCTLPTGKRPQTSRSRTRRTRRVSAECWQHLCAKSKIHSDEVWGQTTTELSERSHAW